MPWQYFGVLTRTGRGRRSKPYPTDIVSCPQSMRAIAQNSSVPPNVTFFVDDLEAEWTYRTPFDFIYMRFMTASIKDFPNLFGQAFK
jgi:hypothetical protein